MTNIININDILNATAFEDLGVSSEEEFDNMEWAIDLNAEEELDFNED